MSLTEVPEYTTFDTIGDVVAHKLFRQGLVKLFRMYAPEYDRTTDRHIILADTGYEKALEAGCRSVFGGDVEPSERFERKRHLEEYLEKLSKKIANKREDYTPGAPQVKAFLIAINQLVDAFGTARSYDGIMAEPLDHSDTGLSEQTARKHAAYISEIVATSHRNREVSALLQNIHGMDQGIEVSTLEKIVDYHPLSPVLTQEVCRWYIHLGALSQARELASTLSDNREREAALYDVALAHVKNNEYDLVLEAANSLQVSREGAIEKIVLSYAQGGNYEAAKELVDGTESIKGVREVHLLCQIALFAHTNENNQEAHETAQKAKGVADSLRANAKNYAYSLCEILNVCHLLNGDEASKDNIITSIRKVLEAASNPKLQLHEKSLVLCAIARHFVCHREIESAQGFLAEAFPGQRSMMRLNGKVSVFCEIALICFEMGQTEPATRMLSKAEECLNRIKDANSYSANIIYEQAQETINTATGAEQECNAGVPTSIEELIEKYQISHDDAEKSDILAAMLELRRKALQEV